MNKTKNNNGDFFLIAGFFSVLAAIWYIFETKKDSPKKGYEQDADNLNLDWDNLYNDYSTANTKLKEKHGVIA